jgi:2-haloacid dehalogenase
MPLDRRSFLKASATLATTHLLGSSSTAKVATSNKFKAIAFDAFVLFDPRPIATLAENLFPGHGNDLMNEWRTRQFEYTWLRTISQRYTSFWQVTRDGLTYATARLKLNPSAEQITRLMQAYLELTPWPDVTPALATLKSAGVRLSILSNFTPQMLASCIKTSGLDGVFEQVLSTDAVRSFKPDPRTYEIGLHALQLTRDQILFAAFAGWDAAGAKTFGYPTFWNNRLDAPPEELGVSADATGKTLTELLHFMDLHKP